MEQARGMTILIVGVLCTGCAPSDWQTSTLMDSGTNGTEAVQLVVNHRSEWRVLWLEGITDLPDGAYVNYRVTHEMAEKMPSEEWPAENLMTVGRAAVEKSAYWARVNTLNWPSGEVRIHIQFPLPPQPPEVDERYGAFGEHLTGDNVVDLGGMKAIEIEHVFDHRR